MHSFGGLLACRCCLGFVEAAYFVRSLSLIPPLPPLDPFADPAGPAAGMPILSELLVHAQGARCPHHVPVHWLAHLGRLFGPDRRRHHGEPRRRPGPARVAVAVAAVFVLPNFPRTTPWLSEQEVAMAVWRLEHDIGQDDWVSSEEQTFLQGFKAAVKDVKTWVLVSFIGLVIQVSSYW